MNTATAPAPAASALRVGLPAKPRPYRRFLTSALHTRFAHAALVSLVLALDNAVLLGPKNSFFWSWFPLGPAGIRALLFLMTTLFIFILQIATLRVGRPTSASPAARFWSTVIGFDAIQTTVWYLISAWWFTEVYIFSSASMSWVTYGDLKTPDKLNERPIYMRTFFTMLALAHVAKHLYYGHSTMYIPVSPAPTPQLKDQRTHPIPDVYTQLKQQARNLLLRNLSIAGVVTAVGPFIYGALLRQTMWKIHLGLAKPFFNLGRSNARATGFPPLVGIIPTTMFCGSLLGMTWEISTFLFLAYLTKAPVKKDKPLSDASKDPNATLLNGLRAKRGLVKTFAFWELAIIGQSQPERRKAIFADIDRPTGPVWASMLGEGLKVVHDIDERISPTPLKSVADDKEPKIETLPTILPAPRTQDILAKNAQVSRRQKLHEFAGDEAKLLGSASKTWAPSPEKVVVKAIEYSKDRVVSPLEQGMVALKTGPVGWFFASTNAAKVNSKVLGSPNGNAALTVDAIEGITRMLVASMQDDTYGKAVKGVPSAVRQFTKTITLIEKLMEEMPPGDGGSREVEIILGRLRASLTELLSAFQNFLFDTGLSVGDLNDAKKASGQKGIEAAKEQQTPAPVEDERPRRVIKVPKEREQNETWREWGSQGRLQNGEPRQPLFQQHTSNRKESRGTSSHALPRRREMEQIGVR